MIPTLVVSLLEQGEAAKAEAEARIRDHAEVAAARSCMRYIADALHIPFETVRTALLDMPESWNHLFEAPFGWMVISNYLAVSLGRDLAPNTPVTIH